MVFCLQAYLIYSDASRRDEVLSTVQSETNAHPQWGATRVIGVFADPQTDEGVGLPVVAVNVRFTTRAALQSVVNRVERFLRGARTPETGSWYGIHDCNHDEGEPYEPCIPEMRVW